MVPMITKSMKEIIPVVGVPRTSIDNWLIPDRLELSTRFDRPENGHPRKFSRANVLELALLAAFVKAGASASIAAVLARAVLAHDRRKSVREFWVFEAGQMRKGIETDTL